MELNETKMSRLSYTLLLYSKLPLGAEQLSTFHSERTWLGLTSPSCVLLAQVLLVVYYCEFADIYRPADAEMASCRFCIIYEVTCERLW